jgi:hypothetical protein
MSTPLGATAVQGAVPQTELSSDCGSGDLVLDVVTVVVADWPPVATGPFCITINRGEEDEEQCYVSALTTTQFTIPSGKRGLNHTSAQSHNAGATITHTSDAGAMQDVIEHAYDETRNDHTQYPLYTPTVAGHPTTGTWVTNQVVIDDSGAAWLCTAGGSPGTWETFALGDASLVSHAGNIGSNVPLGTNTLTEIFATASLAIGTWQVHMHAVVECQDDQSAAAILAAEGTATATFTGVLASEGFSSGADGEVAMSISFLAVVTVAGTLKLSGVQTGADGGNAQYDGSVSGYGGATGYTAIKIA